MLKKYFKYFILLLISSSVFHQLDQYLVMNEMLVDLRNFENISFDSTKSFLIFILFTVIIFPILEEASFRLILVKNPKNIYVGVSFLTGFTIYVLNIEYQWFNLGAFYDLSLLLIFVLLLFFLVKRFKSTLFNVFDKLSSLKMLVLFSSIFALFHFGNSYSSHIVLLSLVPLLKHFVSGLVFGTFRIKYGFIHGFFLHALNNLVASLGVILAFYRS